MTCSAWTSTRTAARRPPIDLDAERRNGEFVRGLIATGRLSAVHDISDGGLYVAVAELCMASDVGAEFNPARWSAGPCSAVRRGPGALYVIALPSALTRQAMRAAAKAGVTARHLGSVSGTDLIAEGCDPISVETLRTAHEGWFPTYMDATH